MIKVLIVDDDMEMLDWLEIIVNWEIYGFIITGRAQSGTEALALCKEEIPDLIISDINMPGMDGLDLITTLKGMKQDIKSIILTCYEDFSYAQRAIKLEADDYVVKYTLTAQGLIGLLQKIKSKMEFEGKRKEEVYLLNRELTSNKTAIEEKFITDIIEGVLTKPRDIQEGAAIMKIALPEGPFRVICTYIDNYETSIKNSEIKETNLLKFCIQNIAEEILQMERSIKCFPCENNKFVILYGDGTEVIPIRQRIIDKLNEFHKAVKNFLNLEISSCVSYVCNSFLDIRAAVDEDLILRDSYFFYGSGRIVIKRDAFSENEVIEWVDEFRKDFIPTLETGDIKAVNQFLGRLYNQVEEGNYSPDAIKKMFAEITMEISTSAIMQGRSSFETRIIDTDTYSALKIAFSKIVDTYLEGFKSLVMSTSRGEIDKVLKYIETNLNGNITCESMAGLVCMNSSYFSRLFKSETRVSFSDYLIRKRIEKATILLERSDMTIEEITKAVGLEQTSYFYKLYKKVTGKTPGEIREKRNGGRYESARI